MVGVVSQVRRKRCVEAGFTLIEVIVSIAILTIIAGIVAAIFGVGFKVVSPTGAQARILGAHDLTVLEQSLGQDGSRAACIEVPPGGVTHTFGSCSGGFAKVSCSSNALCIGWVDVQALSCHVALYQPADGSSGPATRTEYSVTASGVSPPSSVPLAREQPVTITVGTVVTASPPGETYSWVRSLQVTVSVPGLGNAPSQSLSLDPVATDPKGSSAPISGQIPC